MPDNGLVPTRSSPPLVLEVWGGLSRARHQLNRDVAIKVLLPAVANDPDPSTGSGSSRATSRDDRLARFSREAQVLASLNHPNTAHIYGVEESNGVTALVMELVEGWRS